MRVISALDSIFSAVEGPEEEFDHPYENEDEWNTDYEKSRWPGGVRHMTGQVRVGGPELQDHPSYYEMRDAGWRPSRTRDAFVHPKGRVLTYGKSSEFGPKYPNGRTTRWYEQALGEGPVYYRSHERLGDALTAKGWDGETSGLGDEKGIERDLGWLKEDEGR